MLYRFVKALYTVDLGQNGHMPSCGCMDWHTYHWPCKHFNALFQVTSQTWDGLSCCYRDSPYFSVDDDVLKVSPTGQQSLYKCCQWWAASNRESVQHGWSWHDTAAATCCNSGQQDVTHGHGVCWVSKSDFPQCIDIKDGPTGSLFSVIFWCQCIYQLETL